MWLHYSLGATYLALEVAPHPLAVLSLHRYMWQLSLLLSLIISRKSYISQYQMRKIMKYLVHWELVFSTSSFFSLLISIPLFHRASLLCLLFLTKLEMH